MRCSPRGRLALLATVAVGVVPAACGKDADDGAVASTAPAATAPTGSDGCIVRLHGKGGTGADTTVAGDVTVVAPTGNADGWDGRQWLYFPEERYAEALAIVEAAVTGCERVIVGGFSNGASFAAALYCRGETLNGRLVGVVVDDPVPDHSADGCAPVDGVDVTLYWTGALDATATPGWDCAEVDWTCEGGETIGIAAYAAALGAPIEPSAFTDHQPYLDAPELTAFG